MQLKPSAQAVALALLSTAPLYSGDVFALPPTATPAITIYSSGNTAANNFIQYVLANRVCKTGTLDTYRDIPLKGSDFLGFFCTVDSTKVPGLTVKDPNLLVLKRTRTNAELGVYPLLEPTKLIDIMGINNTVNGEPQCTLSTTANVYDCKIDRAGDLFKITPDFGVADVHPSLFRGTNFNPIIDGIAFQQVTAAAVSANLKVQPTGALVFNTPVTLGLRNALQAAQIDQGILDADCLADESQRCQPSLSKDLIASIFAGRLQKWSDVRVNYTPAGSSTAVSRKLTEYGVLPADQKVRICRRNRGAGQQAVPNLYLFNAPCSSTVAPAETGNPLLGPVVHIATSVSGGEACLDDFDKGTNNSTFNTGLTTAWAIGIAATDRNASLAKNYRFIKIDGASPTLDEVFSGHYKMYSEGSFNWRKVDPQPTGNKLTLIQKLAKDAAEPTVLASFNGSSVQPFGRGGYLAISSQGYQVKHPFDPTFPVTPYTHAPTGLGLDGCRIPLLDTGAKGKLPAL